MPKKKNSVDKEVQLEHFRVAIFGSARIQKDDEIYKQVFKLAKSIGKQKFDIVTGGGPGLMEAANAGHQAGDTNHTSDSIGLLIKLPWEAKANGHLEMKKKFNKFSNRLDHFMALSRAIVVVPGGIGTALELFYTWQLIQVKHIPKMPIILVGKMWEELIKWVKKNPLKQGLISPGDLDVIHIAKDEKAAMRMIKNAHKCYLKEGEHYFDNIGKYKIS